MNAKSVEKGFDIWLTKLDENYFVEIATDAGKKLVDKFAKTKKTDEKDIHKRDHIRSNIHKVCSSERKTKAKAGEVPLLIKNNWDHPVWEDLAKKCYSCGSCNIVCPTCYCFDVKDDIEINLKDGTRMRKWDGCQLEDFALVGSGENFREKRVDRFKHRLYRKTVYQYEKYNQLACVGCGRCSSVCLPNIADPVAIINKIKEGK
jgi:ferredoxin